MSGKVRLTKRQVKEDKFTTFMLSSKEKLQSEMADKWQFYVIGFVLVVILIAAMAWQLDRQEARGVEASEAFSRAMVTYQGGDKQVAILEFSQVLENYGSSDVASTATYLLGNLNLTTRNYAEATRYYQLYLDDFSGNSLNRAAALAGLASAMEDQGQYSDAASKFVLACAEYPGGPMEPDYELGAIRNYLADGNLDQADARLAILQENHADADWTKRASRLITEKRLGK
jgi:TolA-binding protein